MTAEAVQRTGSAPAGGGDDARRGEPATAGSSTGGPGGRPTERRNPLSVDLDLMSDPGRAHRDQRGRPPGAGRGRRGARTRSPPRSTSRSRRCAAAAGCTTSGPAPPAGSGVLDAAELAPTFNSPRHWFCAHLAGGPDGDVAAPSRTPRTTSRGGAAEAGRLRTRRRPRGRAGRQRAHPVRPRGARRGPGRAGASTVLLCANPGGRRPPRRSTSSSAWTPDRRWSPGPPG